MILPVMVVLPGCCDYAQHDGQEDMLTAFLRLVSGGSDDVTRDGGFTWMLRLRAASSKQLSPDGEENLFKACAWQFKLMLPAMVVLPGCCDYAQHDGQEGMLTAFLRLAPGGSNDVTGDGGFTWMLRLRAA